MDNRNKICVYAICKNESQFVKRWYESVKDADFIVVLDTGSTDNTVDLFKECGVDIIETQVFDPWRFDDARNAALALVPEEYNILVSIDIDEVLDPGWAEVLKNEWEYGKTQRVEYKYTWSHHSDGSPDVVFKTNKIHSRNFVWKAPVHEYLDYTGDPDALEILDLYDKLHIQQYADRSKSRSSYLPLLKLRVEEDPEDYMGLLYLGRECWFYKELDNAIDIMTNIVTDLKEHYNQYEISFAYNIIGECYRTKMSATQEDEEKIDIASKAIDAFKNGIKTNPIFMDNYTGLGELYINLQNYHGAQFILKKGIRNSRRCYNWLEVGYNWDARLYDALFISTYYCGNKIAALGYAGLALKYAPDNERIKNNYKLCIDSINKSDIL